MWKQCPGSVLFFCQLQPESKKCWRPSGVRGTDLKKKREIKQPKVGLFSSEEEILTFDPYFQRCAYILWRTWCPIHTNDRYLAEGNCIHFFIHQKIRCQVLRGNVAKSWKEWRLRVESRTAWNWLSVPSLLATWPCVSLTVPLVSLSAECTYKYLSHWVIERIKWKSLLRIKILPLTW